ncbi:isoleucine--tRNA ligase, cytoplasmic-like [Amphibalanus amphitrite]|uniref:isoleucine--tRNA ligase, cytoplasmic-like n=1 Tax=Amphibalanus amphitrite TaxID=1232801 RepID=UPI001C8FBC5B|nr:isoleucine--tRNA ligase, cytoplasmic-like [Amphibalanus amphitrite]XP_043220916.1 isoleucine--tRNA ligase, cytoplasmic-like [Amphibalanus amphitrite]XP_043220917.1 isoleucine--tRNA ligase, cytoplasmic-like [Amphibalanus amphitrite]XP_043220918.1 isoleucine--tRNA ligase, cytoplasmic-like [Amphibalanus amphitrite]XP_043220919.1 isoleucine--tRNA ligase, cytoplasmic-like [Amphibalanus amphitrite]XP_043220920.1 isoleucine--tRNA ligase, cytoplasmic-like [Amphibalanus amphitrite]XP_043220921.1 is
MAQPVPEQISFPAEEEKMLALWKEIDAFQTCLRQSRGRPRFSFYDGPPFATGLPHYGHILAGTIKDIVTRYAHQSGFHVERRFGWDCHGLPVEYEIDKTLDIRGPDDVAKMGIDKYNAECRKIVSRYAHEWEACVGRMGRWIDFRNDYKTLYPWYMESIWWVFKQLFTKGLVYRGFKVMPYSTGCNTPLSNFESGQNYKDVVDPAVTVSFPLEDEPDVSMLAWTTTPWTLPSNLALCVHPELDYVQIQEKQSGKKYIMMEARLSSMYKSEDDYTVMKKMKGSKLKGRPYKPLFNYFEKMKASGAFHVQTDTYVTEESGTGVVHQAPYFGEDDYRVCLAAGIITKDMEMVCPVDASGRFTEPVTHFKGQYVKDADKNIVKHLKEAGRLVVSATCKHSYPFCWRSDTPLIYKAVPSWFVRVEHMTQELLKNNSQTYWVPDFIKEKRFGNWLRDARDWAISRNRYWGTPIPLWVSEDMEEVVCVGSIEELQRLTGVTVDDLHREIVDKLTIPSRRPGQPPLRRVTEVFDCWFESGSMPYAQAHYPFENRRQFEDSFPADFVAEGIDQTRGWFYTLLVLSTALFDKPPFKNLIANGMVLAADGQKMSKRKKNYPDPMLIVERYGADALRLYLINSPVVRGESLRFKEEGVRDVLKDVFLPWYNAYRFLVQNVHGFEKDTGEKFMYDEGKVVPSTNLMDRWIVSFTQSLLLFVKQEMAAYRLYTVVPRLVKFVDNLTNWYVRMNRKRLKGEGGADDCRDALNTLFSVLFSMCRVMAPFTPFLTETMYQNLRHLSSSAEVASVHYLSLPEARQELIDAVIERSVSRMQAIIELGRIIRDRKTMPVKYPLPEVVVIHADAAVLGELEPLVGYVMDELNVRKVTRSGDKDRYGVQLRAEPNHRTLGARLKGDFKAVMADVKALDDAALQKFLDSGSLTLRGHQLTPEDVHVRYSADGPAAAASHYEAHSDNDILVLLDTTPDQSMLDEGIAREIINRVQKLRKKASLVPTDAITAYYGVSPAEGELARVAASHQTFIEGTLKAPFRPAVSRTGAGPAIIEETTDVKGAKLAVSLVAGFCADWTVQSEAGEAGSAGDGAQPFCSYVNLELMDTEPINGARSPLATVLLENPAGENRLSVEQLVTEAQVVFGQQRRKVFIYDGPEAAREVTSLDGLSGRTLYVYTRPDKTERRPASCPRQAQPQARFVNVQNGSRRATLLVENPRGSFVLDGAGVGRRAGALLGLSTPATLSRSEGGAPLPANADVAAMNGQTLFVCKR